jgi:glycerol-3-phosphate acyltransferase PlsY
MFESIEPLPAILTVAFGYLCGSIPFGLLLTRAAGLGDIRAIGSGNIGATNVLRTGNTQLAAATLLCDMLKGLVPVILLDFSYGRELAIVAGFGAFMGHIFPVWLKFRGGKGVATFVGVLTGLFWPAALAFGAIWVSIAWLTRYSSLAALIASAAVPLILYQFGLLPETVLFALLAAILWTKHHENIRRLMSGTEGRIGEDKAASAAD